jgi:hypothetical protein
LAVAAAATVEVALILGFTFVGHIATNHAAFRLGIRDAKW